MWDFPTERALPRAPFKFYSRVRKIPSILATKKNPPFLQFSQLQFPPRRRSAVGGEVDVAVLVGGEELEEVEVALGAGDADERLGHAAARRPDGDLAVGAVGDERLGDAREAAHDGEEERRALQRRRFGPRRAAVR